MSDPKTQALDELLTPEALRDKPDPLAGTVGELTPDALREPGDLVPPADKAPAPAKTSTTEAPVSEPTLEQLLKKVAALEDEIDGLKADRDLANEKRAWVAKRAAADAESAAVTVNVGGRRALTPEDLPGILQNPNLARRKVSLDDLIPDNLK